MPVGQITRNQIEGNSVGVGFYGYSGFSGWSGWSGWSGPTGPAGGINVSAGKYAWVNDVLIFDAGNYRAAAAGKNCWQIWPFINNYTGINPIVRWQDGDSTVTGFTTKLRIKAVIQWVWGAVSGNLYKIRIRQVLAYSRDYPWDYSMASYADNNVIIDDMRRYTVWGPVVPNSECSAYFSADGSVGASGETDLYPVTLTGPWCSLPGDGNYMVEAYILGGYWEADKVYLEFAKVKT